MRNAGGWLCISDPDAKSAITEFDTFTCQHCSLVITVPPGTETVRVSICRRCGHRVCGPCTRFGCDPIEAKIERHEAIGRRVEQENIERALQRQEALRAYEGNVRG